MSFPVVTHRQANRGKRRELRHAGNHRQGLSSTRFITPLDCALSGDFREGDLA